MLGRQSEGSKGAKSLLDERGRPLTRNNGPLFLTYEWMSTDPVGEARRIADWLHLNLTLEEVESTVNLSSFNHMKVKLEQANSNFARPFGGAKGHQIARAGNACGFEAILTNESRTRAIKLMRQYLKPPLQQLYTATERGLCGSKYASMGL